MASDFLRALGAKAPTERQNRVDAETLGNAGAMLTRWATERDDNLLYNMVLLTAAAVLMAGEHELLGEPNRLKDFLLVVNEVWKDIGGDEVTPPG